MKSRTVDATFVTKTKRLFDAIKEDNLTLYAAQASFFICISVIPFIMLLLSLARLILPGQIDDAITIVRGALPSSSRGLFDLIVSDVTDRAYAPLLSFVTIGLVWTASRGLSSVVRGVSKVYGKDTGGSFWIRIVKTVLYTVSFVIIMIVTMAALVFGKYFKDLMTSSVGEVPMFVRYKEVITFFILTLFFSLLYYFVAKGAFASSGFKIVKGGAKFCEQLPGAALAAVGWIVFSLAYSFYFESFPRFSYIYGSLAAVVFLMLWLYFCMLILLSGAMLNKMLSERKTAKK